MTSLVKYTRNFYCVSKGDVKNTDRELYYILCGISLLNNTLDVPLNTHNLYGWSMSGGPWCPTRHT